jgi:hypothetical protein
MMDGDSMNDMNDLNMEMGGALLSNEGEYNPGIEDSARLSYQ